MNKSLENRIDSFQRRMLRYTLDIRWPEKISNDELNKLTKKEPWSITIRRRRLNLLGHIMRLPSDTPIRKAINECFTPCKNKVGRPKQTWLHTIKDDLIRINIKLNLQDPTAVDTLTDLTKEELFGKRLKVLLMQ